MSLPKISVVTPSFNQGKFLERTILSVIDQGYPNLEYFIVDGGSTDDSLEIIRKYEYALSWWVSEPDGGQTEAINKGLRRATGDWIAWQNSDDIYYPGVFHDLAYVASSKPTVGIVIGDILLINEHDRKLRDVRYVRPTYNSMRAEGMVIANQAAFWRRSIHGEMGLLNKEFRYSFDYEWFLRIIKKTECLHIPKIWGALRLHGESKTSTQAKYFQIENNRILAGREIHDWIKPFFRVRRLVLMLARGQVKYALRGLLRRARILAGDNV